MSVTSSCSTETDLRRALLGDEGEGSAREEIELRGVSRLLFQGRLPNDDSAWRATPAHASGRLALLAATTSSFQRRCPTPPGA